MGKKKREYITRVHDKPYQPYWTCQLCYPTVLELGQINGIGWLIYDRDGETGKDRYAIIHGQGHRDDQTVFFDEKPRIEREEYGNYPVPYNFTTTSFFAAINMFESMKEMVGEKYFKDERGAKWGISAGKVSEWVIIQCANIITRWEKKFGNVEKFYKKFHVRQTKAWEVRRKKMDKQLEEQKKIELELSVRAKFLERD